MAGRPYRSYRVYAYIALARLFHALDLELTQPDLLERAPERIAGAAERISKEEILHAIRSNSHMTEKVLDYLVEQRFATVTHLEHGYDIRITPEGVDHLRRYHALYRDLYHRELDGQYRYTGVPAWLRHHPAATAVDVPGGDEAPPATVPASRTRDQRRTTSRG